MHQPISTVFGQEPSLKTQPSIYINIEYTGVSNIPIFHPITQKEERLLSNIVLAALKIVLALVIVSSSIHALITHA
jgi:hypothetical protein